MRRRISETFVFFMQCEDCKWTESVAFGESAKASSSGYAIITRLYIGNEPNWQNNMASMALKCVCGEVAKGSNESIFNDVAGIARRLG